MSRYKIRIKPHDQRMREVGLRADEASKLGRARQEFKFRSGKDPLPVITTSDDQLNMVAEGKAEKGFFAPTRREDPSVQQVQHELLPKLAQTGSGETVKPDLR